VKEKVTVQGPEKTTEKVQEELTKRAKAKVNEAYAELIPRPGAYTTSLITKQAQFGFMMRDVKSRVHDLYKDVSGLLVPSLTAPFTYLVATFNEFFVALSENLAVWSTVIESKRQAMPNCIGNKEEFKELCRIAAKVIGDKSFDIHPHLKEMIDATNGVVKAVIELNTDIIAGIDTPELRKALQDSNDEILAVSEKIRALKQQKQEAMLCAEFMKQNDQNQARQADYLTARMNALANETSNLNGKISSALANETTTHHTEERSSGWWFFRSRYQNTTTTRTDANSSGLKAHKGVLESQLDSVRNQLDQLAKNNLDKKNSIGKIADISGYDEQIAQAQENLKKLQNNLDNKRQAMLASRLNGAGMLPGTSQKIVDIIMTLSFLLSSIGFITGQLDTTRLDVLETLKSNVLSPATILSSTSYIFKYSVMYNIFNIGDFGDTGDILFDECYTRYLQNVQASSNAVIKMTAVPPEKIVEKDRAISNTMSGEQMAMDLYGC